MGAALGNYYVVHYAQPVDMRSLVASLQRSGVVRAAYPAPVVEPPPATPTFVSLQTYLDAAPTGSAATFASGFPGGSGSAVKLVDVEYSWNLDHEDLTHADAALVPHGTPVDPFSNDDHGTAVLGEIDADANVFGVTGAAPGVTLALVNADNAESGYDPAGALATAASITEPGDVVLVEQQAAGPDRGNFVPAEWIPEVYDAIRGLTSLGRIVVEPAGNGGEDLDVAVYGSPFPLGQPDSGAIIVGAGENCATTSPRRSRLSFSDFGARVDLQGPGDCVVTTGYGDLYDTGGVDAEYTQQFSGTSSATPVVAAAAASLSSVYKTLNHGDVMSPDRVRSILEQSSTAESFGTGALTGNIGPFPDLEKVLARDLTAPTVAMLQPGSAVHLSPALPVAWSGADPSGIGSFDVQREAASWNAAPGPWVSWLAGTAATAQTYAGPYGQMSCFEVRATDTAGNLSDWSPPCCTSVPLRSNQLTYSQHWRRVAVPTALAGVEYTTKTHGARVTRAKIVAQSVYLVVTKCSGCGRLDVRWNGELEKTVSLANRTTAREQVVPIVAFATPQSGTLTATVASPNGHPVFVEGLALSDG